jgi:hypothetical protein
MIPSISQMTQRVLNPPGRGQRVLKPPRGNGSKLVGPVTSQKSWLDSCPAQKVLKRKGEVQNFEQIKQSQIERHHEKQQSNYEEQRAIWAREGVFWCKYTETFESRLDGKPSQPVSGHWFHNKDKGVLEMYNDLRQPAVETKEVFFFNKRAK